MRAPGKLGVALLLAVICSGTLIATAGGVAGQEAATPQSNVSTVTVQSGESIQAAINNANPGDTVEIRSGTYEQRIVVNKSLTLSGSDDTILDGNNLGDVNGITVTGSDVTIENIEVRRFGDSGVDVSGGDALTRTLVVRNTTSRLNDDHGLFVQATEDTSEVTITGSQFTDNSDSGVLGSGDFDRVTINSTEAAGNTDNGISFTTTTATIRDVQSSDNGQSDFNDNYEGVNVDGAEDVSLVNVTARDNHDDNILISGTPLTRTVNVTNVTVLRSETNDGFVVEGATENDVTNGDGIKAVANNDNGIDITADSVTLSNVESRENSRHGILFSGTAATLRNIQASNNGQSDFTDNYEGIAIDGAEDVRLSNITARDNQDDNILVSGEPLTRTVNITNATVLRSVSDSGIDIDKATEEDSITATRITATDNNDNGLEFNAASVTVNNATVSDHSLTGISITGTSATLRNVKSNNNGQSDFTDNYQGININNAEDIDLIDISAQGNYDTNVRISGEPLSRTINITNISVRNSEERSGLGITGSTEGNEITITNASATGNDDDGIYLSAASTSITDATVSGNSEDGIEFRALSGAASVSQSSILDNGEAAIRNQADATTVDATGNWWGDPAGPADDAIIGGVDTSNPLGSAPGVDLVFNPENVTITPSSQQTLVLSAEGAGDGVSLYEFTISVENTSVARLESVSPTRTPELSEDIQVSADGSTATVSVVLGTNAYNASDPSLIDLSVASVDNGSTPIRVTNATIAASSGEYTIGSMFPANVTVQATTEPSVSDYTNSEGIVETSGLLTAIGDWRNDEIGTDLLLDTIAAWRSGTPVN